MATGDVDLDDIESYYDTVPRATAQVEEIGPFTLFVSDVRFPFYARPRLHDTTPIGAVDVAEVRARQRELGVPEALEWIDDLQPELTGAVRAAGMVVFRLPLLVARQDCEVPPPDLISLRVIRPADPGLPSVQAAIGLGFAHPGTGIGLAGDAQRSAAELALADGDADADRSTRDRIASGAHVVVGAFATTGAVAGGSHSPRAGVTEITGVATLPAYRRRGIGAAVTASLVRHARASELSVCFLTAGSEEVARVYRRAGFERVGTACVAGAPG